MKTKEECKNKIAKDNNFDSFERAIRYTFKRELLQSEKEFIDKIIDETMEEYAQQQVKNNIALGSFNNSGHNIEATLFAFAKFAMPTNYTEFALKNIIKQFIEESK